MTSVPRRIQLRVAQKRAYVWDVDDIAILRSQHHICGILTGTLPQLSQQNLFLGLPLLLLPEEVVLLVENGAAILVDDARSYPPPTAEQLKRWKDKQDEIMTQQLSENEAKDAKDIHMDRSMTDEAIRKRQERQAKKMAIAAANAEEAGEPLGTAEPQPSAEKEEPSSSTTYNISIPSSATTNEWYADLCSYTTIESAKAARIWDYPSTLRERAQCGVFRGLWSQGYFMGTGIKFGGDYLVYPGDPLRYHSHFVASVLESPISALQPMQIVAHGRLGTVTKKSHLLCGWDDEKKEVTFMSIEWAGFG